MGMNSSKDGLSYTKIGRQVTVMGEISVTSVSGCSGSITFSLPFAVVDIGDLSERATGSFTIQNCDFHDSVKWMTCGTYQGQTEMSVEGALDNGTWQYLNSNTFGSSTELKVSLTYFT